MQQRRIRDPARHSKAFKLLIDPRILCSKPQSLISTSTTCELVPAVLKRPVLKRVVCKTWEIPFNPTVLVYSCHNRIYVNLNLWKLRCTMMPGTRIASQNSGWRAQYLQFRHQNSKGTTMGCCLPFSNPLTPAWAMENYCPFAPPYCPGWQQGTHETVLLYAPPQSTWSYFSFHNVGMGMSLHVTGK